jgi:ATP-dependent protease ClpP protease subunit
MAFSIMVNCSNRYVLPNAQLLFHPVRVGLMGSMLAEELQKLATELAFLDTTLQDLLVSSMGIDRNVMLEAYYDEKWWTPKEMQAVTTAGWLTIVDDIVGINNLFTISPKKVKGNHSAELTEYDYVIFNTKTN